MRSNTIIMNNNNLSRELHLTSLVSIFFVIQFIELKMLQIFSNLTDLILKMHNGSRGNQSKSGIK